MTLAQYRSRLAGEEVNLNQNFVYLRRALQVNQCFIIGGWLGLKLYILKD